MVTILIKSTGKYQYDIGGKNLGVAERVNQQYLLEYDLYECAFLD